MSIINFFEPIGIIVFALSGALAAREQKMDLFGILMLATLTATGGGIIRDVVMDNGIPMFFRRPSYMVYILAACLLALTARQLVLKAERLIIWLDAVGLACFAIDAGSKVIDKDLGLMAFLFVSVTSGVGGGVLRDLLSQQVPTILTKDIYAVAALIGSLVYYLMQDSPLHLAAPYLGLVIIIATRLCCHALNIHLYVPKLLEKPAK